MASARCFTAPSFHASHAGSMAGAMLSGFKPKRSRSKHAISSRSTSPMRSEVGGNKTCLTVTSAALASLHDALLVPKAVLTAVRTALRARRRQYEVRELLAERERQAGA